MFESYGGSMRVRTIIFRTVVCLGVAACVAALCSKGDTFPGNRTRSAGAIISPNGKTVASVSNEEKKIRLWDMEDRKNRRTLQWQSGGRCRALAFSHDGMLLASGGEDNAIHLRNVSSGAERANLHGHTAAILSLAFSPDGKTLASGGEDKTIRLWNLATGEQCAILQGHGTPVRELVFSPDGTTLASGSDDGMVKLWDIGAREVRTTLNHSGEHQPVITLAFSPDSMTLASGGRIGTLNLWDVSSGQKLSLELPNWLGERSTDYVDYIAFSPDGRTLAAGTSEVIGVWNLTTGKYTGSYGWNQRPFDWTIWSLLDSLGVTDDSHRSVRSVWFSPDGKLFALGFDGDSVMMWQASAFPITGFGVICGLAAGIVFLPTLGFLRALFCLPATTPGQRRPRCYRPPAGLDLESVRILRGVHCCICVAVVLLVVLLLTSGNH
jgi:WD40 repeat protein